VQTGAPLSREILKIVPEMTYNVLSGTLSLHSREVLITAGGQNATSVVHVEKVMYVSQQYLCDGNGA